MKKNLTFTRTVMQATRFFGVLLVSFIAVFAFSCKNKSTDFSEISGTIISQDKNGNVITDITAGILESAGFEFGDLLTVTVDNMNGAAPYVSDYSDVERGEVLVRLTDSEYLEVAINMSSFADRFGTFANNKKTLTGAAISLSLAKKAAYRGKYERKHLLKSENASDFSSDTVFADFQEVTANSIAPGVIYKSAHPSLNTARSQAAVLLTEKTLIKTVLNMSDDAATIQENAQNSAWYASLVKSGNVIPVDAGNDFSADEFSVKLRVTVQFMLAHNAPFLVHAVTDEDSASFLIALLEALCGSSLADITESFMVSYENYYGLQKGDAKYAAISQIILDLFQDLNNGIPVTDETVSEFASTYLTETIGLPPDTVRALRTRLTSPMLN
ncbi:MAG: hypothetical protein Ta2A_06410 [Treponemataceae bacterium]|nr:MAG: hypothetical protein Ta2A_06410 [Treponemataceae bacterium]